MLRAVIAGRTVRLSGCDDFRYASYIRRFSRNYDGAADFSMHVRTTESIHMPNGRSDGVFGGLRRVRLTDERTAVHPIDERYILTFDDAFSEVCLTLKSDMPDLVTRQYLYLVQSFANHLLVNSGCALHGAGLRLGADGIVLSGKSGVGKSTMARLLRECEPSMTVLSEDVPALTATSDGWRLHGTPFVGADTQCADEEAPLCTVVILRQASYNRVTTLSAKDALFHVLANMLRPIYHEGLGEIAADRAVRLCSQIPILQFENDGTSAAAQMLMRALGAR